MFLRAVPVGSPVVVPAATFPYGTNQSVDDFQHQPERPVDLPAFLLDPYETTREEYARFHQDWLLHRDWFQEPLLQPLWLLDDGSLSSGSTGLSASDVCWRDAVRYANWAGKRLPTDREWERAAGGPEGRT
jgi:formylglycine-generating enzyme required for sulfatase activity